MENIRGLESSAGSSNWSGEFEGPDIFQRGFLPGRKRGWAPFHSKERGTKMVAGLLEKLVGPTDCLSPWHLTWSKNWNGKLLARLLIQLLVDRMFCWVKLRAAAVSELMIEELHARPAKTLLDHLLDLQEKTTYHTLIVYAMVEISMDGSKILLLQTAGSNLLFSAVTETSDSILKGAEASGFDGLVTGFHHGVLKLAMEPSLLGTALMEGGSDIKIKLDRSPAVDVVYLKSLPPNSSLIEEIMNRVKGFLVSKALLKGDPSITSHPSSHLRCEREWRIGPTVLTAGEHLFVNFAIRILRKQAHKYIRQHQMETEE